MASRMRARTEATTRTRAATVTLKAVVTAVTTKAVASKQPEIIM